MSLFWHENVPFRHENAPFWHENAYILALKIPIFWHLHCQFSSIMTENYCILNAKIMFMKLKINKTPK